MLQTCIKELLFLNMYITFEWTSMLKRSTNSDWSYELILNSYHDTYPTFLVRVILKLKNPVNDFNDSLFHTHTHTYTQFYPYKAKLHRCILDSRTYKNQHSSSIHKIYISQHELHCKLWKIAILNWTHMFLLYSQH